MIVTTAWIPATYPVKTSHNFRRVSGDVYGVWGVGPALGPLGPRDDAFVVTHLPTGMQFGPAWESPEQARAFAEAVTPLRDDWPTFGDTTEVTREFRTAVWSVASRIESQFEEVEA